jgi:hypothetical protein
VPSVAPTTAVSATCECPTSADCTSAVELRCADTFITSSTQQPDVGVVVVARAAAKDQSCSASRDQYCSLVPLRIAPDCAQHRWPWLIQHQIALRVLAEHVGLRLTRLPWSSTMRAKIPGTGAIAEPGIVVLTPGNGEIINAPSRSATRYRQQESYCRPTHLDTSATPQD